MASVGTPLPAGIVMPHGIVDLTLEFGTAGTDTGVVLTYPMTLPAGARYFKFGPTSDNPVPHWYVYPRAVISGNTVTLSFTDGSNGDSDLTANSVILDPGGVGFGVLPGELGDAQVIPSLQAWTQLALAMLLMLLGAPVLRRRMIG